MEFAEAGRALKSSFIVVPETAMKSTTNNPCDDFWCVTGLPGGADDFSIDHFFDLPNEDDTVKEEKEDEEEEEKYSNSSLSLDDSNSLDFSRELAIPVDDVQDLELWSHLMDDSIPEPTLACPILTSFGQNTKTDFLPPVEPGRKPGYTRVLFVPSVVPHKPRSKRPRTAANRSKFRILPKTECFSTSSPSSPVSTLLFSPGPRHFLTVGKPALKKPAFQPTGPAVQRRCSHCQVTKTPQWRAGPSGPKSLCNACGVRFKSGRLFPEYRPACSPTFSSEVHSNSHRKVLEMRRLKEVTEPLSGSGVARVEVRPV